MNGMLLKITLLSLADWDWKGLFKGKKVALKSAVACCLTYLLATGAVTFAGTLQCPWNAFHQETCLNWFGFWGPQDFWKSSGIALKNVEKTEKPMWLNIWPHAYVKLGWNIWLGWVLCGHELSSVLLASSWRPATICPRASASLVTTHFQLQLVCLEFSAMSPQNQNCTSESAVRYKSHKQDHGSIYFIGSAAGSFVCGGWWWGKLAPPPFIGALPFDGGKGSKKLSMRWKTRPIRHQECISRRHSTFSA